MDPVAVIAIMESMHVNEDIYNLAFGESTLNDGVAIVMFNLFKGIDSLHSQNKSSGEILGLGIAKFLVSVLGAMLLAMVLTLLVCLITKMSYKIPNVEPLLFLVAAMVSYALADMLLFSSVISVMTSALVLVRYGEYNLQRSSVESFQTIVHMLAQTFESLLFFDMGVQIAYAFFEADKFDWTFVFVSIPYTFVARLVGVFVQTFFLNFRRRKVGK